jgi:hypothetical protein
MGQFCLASLSFVSFVESILIYYNIIHYTLLQEEDFFAHPVCTHLTEKINFVLSWILSFFRQFTTYPTQLVTTKSSVFDTPIFLPSFLLSF